MAIERRHATHSALGDVLGADHHRHHATSRGIALSTNRKNRTLRARDLSLRCGPWSVRTPAFTVFCGRLDRRLLRADSCRFLGGHWVPAVHPFPVLRRSRCLGLQNGQIHTSNRGSPVRSLHRPPASPDKLGRFPASRKPPSFQRLGRRNAVCARDFFRLRRRSGWKCRQSLTAKFRFPK
jgi:hypothetical protein